MTAEEFLNNRLVAAGVLVAILGFFTWLNVRSARKVSRRQREILEGIKQRTRELLERMRRGGGEPLRHRCLPGDAAYLAEAIEDSGSHVECAVERPLGRRLVQQLTPDGHPDPEAPPRRPGQARGATRT